MEGEQHHYELRSRSRSRSQTPQVLNRGSNDTESPEHHYDLRRRSRERSHTPGEVTSSRRSGSRSLPGSIGKSPDKTMETISEQKEEIESQNQQSQTTKSVSTKKVERRSERQRAKRQIFSNGQSESSENKDNSKTERERQSLTPRRIFTSDYSSEEGDHEDREEREDPPSRPGSAYEIYKQAGEWWNVFPKTDYTYSQKSQCRYEIAPGVMAMPNMSRRSIHSDTSSTHGSIPSTSQQNLSQSLSQLGESTSQFERDSFGKELSATDNLLLRNRHPDSVTRAKLYKTTHVEQFSSRREFIYSDSANSESFHDRSWPEDYIPSKIAYPYRSVLQADSDVDIDDTITSVDGHRRLYRERQQKELNVFLKIWISVVTFITTSYTSAKNYIGLGGNRRWQSSNYNYRQQSESRWSKAWSSIDCALQYLYSLFVNALFLDTWLLSRAAPVRERIPDRRTKLIWIVLLPLLLLGGLWLLSYAFSNKNSIPALFTYSTSALSSLFYLEPSTRKVQHGSAIETIVGEVPPMADSFELTEQKIYGWKDEIIPSPVQSSREIDNQKLKELDSIISLLVERVKLVENANVYQNEPNVIIETTADLKKHYDEKLAAIEKKIEDNEKRVLTSNANEIRELKSTIKSCCEKTAAIPVVEVEEHINNILGGYFSSENIDETRTVSKEDLARTIKNLFIAKNDLEARIADINSTLQVNVQEVHNLAEKVMADITSQINLHMLASDDGGDKRSGGDGSGGLTERDVRRIVTNALKIYDADKTGRVDYALESAGGQVISTRCTQKYNLDTRAYTIYGYVLFYQNTNPQTVIQGDPIQPGKCWVFQDFPGYLLIKLRTWIHITGFTIEHAPRSILPNGDMRSAPRKFNVWGYNDENDKEPVQLGEYEFEDSDENLQYFPVQNATNKPYEIVELRIHSNHGQMHYTSLYRFRVHGIPA
ncbi:klaroid protein-like isoform X2 [Athalia rosae]|uniref:klaroid protein-like isoform X2 n=1 Tax=Athalia rosae TaxID=37344 RepID=UPI000A0ED1B2|nr:klaroid protein-like isoform X2 [Athalia rosae]